MLWASYGKLTSESVKGMITNPQNRAEAVKRLAEALGGRMVSYHMLLNGEIDFFIISDIPDEKITNVALVNHMLVRGTGGVENVVSVPCLLPEDAVPHMEKAKEMVAAMAYKPAAQQ
jgi:uncharacterized protein with GYD domain